ncbi:MAG: FAD-dependent oxidoreductase [Gammaproteobacteria bacterium]|nr:MAG: FAD-dependent oxidoreductase [Gammaproteobacteria bacterium]
MKEKKYADIIIVGGGPAGLATAYCLQKLNIDCLVVEKNKVGNSWGNMPKYWRVVSPQWTNMLPGSGFPYSSPFSKPWVNSYREYLLQYSKINSIKVHEEINIYNVLQIDNCKKFKLTSDDLDFECKIIVSATGYYSNPYIPSLPRGDDDSIRSFHVSEYFSPERLKKLFPHCTKILIVGRRVSAGQLLTDLSKHDFSLSISARGSVSPRDGSFKGKIKDFIYFPYEELKVKLNPNIYADSFPHMDGGKTEELLKEKIVTVHSNIVGIRDRHVVFEDGASDKFDLIIYATGYKPSLAYLKDIVRFEDDGDMPIIKDMHCSDIENIFFIGLDQIYNFRSRYLRGIRKDAVVLANDINVALRKIK